MMGAQTPADTIQAANQQSSALGRLMVIVENARSCAPMSSSTV